jgi:peptidyl-prolyl cis-trans isomerase A (cyclophilin A)
MFTLITKKTMKKLGSVSSILALTLGLANTASATIVEFRISYGDIQKNIQVNLYDETTPKTVANFLSYVNSQHYDNSVIHRVSPGFVVQGGGFEFSGVLPLSPLTANAPVVNEAIYSNVKGTIAMAKQGGNINSATNQWFFNLTDSSENLDRQNGGFTVFGQVIGDGMSVIEEISQLNLCNSGALEGIPMVMDESQKCSDLSVPGVENFVVIEQISVTDSSEVTDSELHPLLTKFPDSDGDGVKDIDDAFPNDPSKYLPDAEESSGGSVTWFALAMLSLITTRKRFLKI